MAKIFLSYVHEDWELVRKLAGSLQRHGVEVWLDREQIRPGQKWQDAISAAIAEGDFFMACFSVAYTRKASSYMNEELTQAIEQLRLRPANTSWFIPVLLDDAEIPARKIGAGETLRSIQWADLNASWESGLQEILRTIRVSRAVSGDNLAIDRREIVTLLKLMGINQIIPSERYPLGEDGGCPKCEKGKLVLTGEYHCNDGPWNVYSCTACDWECRDLEVYGTDGLLWNVIAYNRLRHRFGLL